MNAKHLIKFIKQKMRTNGSDKVLRNEDDSWTTLEQLCESVRIQNGNVSVDQVLDCHLKKCASSDQTKSKIRIGKVWSDLLNELVQTMSIDCFYALSVGRLV